MELRRVIKINKRYCLHTPIGNIPFTKDQNDFYSKLTDIELLKLYLKQKKDSGGFVSPETFSVMVDRELIFKGEFTKDIEERLKKLEEERR